MESDSHLEKTFCEIITLPYWTIAPSKHRAQKLGRASDVDSLSYINQQYSVGPEKKHAELSPLAMR